MQILLLIGHSIIHKCCRVLSSRFSLNTTSYNHLSIIYTKVNKTSRVLCQYISISSTSVKEQAFTSLRPKQKYMCVYCHMSKKSRVGRSAFIFFLTIDKTGYSRSRFRFFIFEISGKPSFVLWRVTQFFYLLCSQFRQKASGWINKTLLLIKQQKWLSKFCVKIDRVGGWKIGWVGWP